MMARAPGGDSALVYLLNDRMDNLPDVPYIQTKNAFVVILTTVESEQAVGNMRVELLSTIHQGLASDGGRRRQNGGLNTTMNQKMDVQGAGHRSAKDRGGGRQGWSGQDPSSMGRGGQSAGALSTGRQ